jgi:hypothetical protein
MRTFKVSLIAAVMAVLTGAMLLVTANVAHGAISSAVPSLGAKQKFQQVVYVGGTTVGRGAKNGNGRQNALPFADQDLWRIPANVVIEKVWVIIDTLITGTTALTIGDDDDADGFVTDASLTLGTVGMYGFNAKVAGAYMRVETAGATDALDVYVVPSVKYYSASGKEVKMDITTANTAGEMRVFIEGFSVGANSSTL